MHQLKILAASLEISCSVSQNFLQRLSKFLAARNFICRYGKQNFQQQKIAFPHAENK